MSEKRRVHFSILGGKRDEKGHPPPGPAGLGTLNLSHMSAILLTETSAEVDMGLIHAKSRVERGIRFSRDRESVGENYQRYGVVWVTVDDYPSGRGYAGVTACTMLINAGLKKGYKNLPDHVNSMGDSLKGKISLDPLTPLEGEQLMLFLRNDKRDLWENSPASVRGSLVSCCPKG
ncbi:YwhD family protein [Pasteuria penetrans]|uniref:YwhD family protein n=1 Tax=Pasteuria penetrans TaxID=86005 RepID=UPI000FA90341|nr:YwhD family protein [Pasteuria penetrans]